MCSSACATPEVPSTSSIDPTRTQSIWTAVGARRSGCTIKVMPLLRVNCSATGAPLDGDAVADFGGEDCAKAGRAQGAESTKASTAPSAARRGEGCFIEWLGL